MVLVWAHFVGVQFDLETRGPQFRYLVIRFGCRCLLLCYSVIVWTAAFVLSWNTYKQNILIIDPMRDSLINILY